MGINKRFYERFVPKPSVMKKDSEQEVFTVSYAYKGKHYQAEVRTQWPEGPEPPDATYEIWINNNHEFTIRHSLDECYMPCWVPVDENADKRLVEVVGEAIERHFG